MLIRQNPMIKSSDIEKMLGLSRKQLNYSMRKINAWLQWEHLPVIQRTKQGGFILNEQASVKLFTQKAEPESGYVYSHEERLQISILILLGMQDVTLNHFVSILEISKNTALSTLKQLQILIRRFNLELRYSREFGYQLTGREFNRRQLLSEALNSVINQLESPRLNRILQIRPEQIQTLDRQLNLIEKQLKIRFTDQVMKFLPYFLTIVFRRIQQGQIIEDFEVSAHSFRHTREYEVARDLLSNVNTCPDEEYLYLTLLLLTSNFRFMSDNHDAKDMDIYLSVYEMIEAFETVSCIRFNHKEQLVDYIFQHWKAAYYRILYDFHIENQMLEAIKNRYTYLFDLTRRSIYPLEKTLNKPIPEEEIGFITILYGGWLRREKQMDQAAANPRAIFVCENGVAISSYMYLELKDLLPQLDFGGVYSVREFRNQKIECDLIFSTVPLEVPVKTFVLQPMMSEPEKQSFAHQVQMYLAGFNLQVNEVDDYMDVIEQYAKVENKEELRKGLSRLLYRQNEKLPAAKNPAQPDLADLLVPGHVMLAEVTDWKEAVSLGARPLLEKGLIQERYLQTMIRQILIQRPYIMVADGVIIAHAAIDAGVNETCMSLVRLPHKIAIHDYLQADIILILATVDFQNHLKALSQFNERVSEPEGLARIRRAADADALRAVLIGKEG